MNTTTAMDVVRELVEAIEESGFLGSVQTSDAYLNAVAALDEWSGNDEEDSSVTYSDVKTALAQAEKLCRAGEVDESHNLVVLAISYGASAHDVQYNLSDETMAALRAHVRELEAAG